MVQEISSVNDYGDGIAWMRGPLLGNGSFGRVFMATLKNHVSHYTFLPPVIAVKSAEVSLSGSLRVEREIMGNFKGCPYLIQCFAQETTVGDGGALAYNLLLEYASGGTLADAIKKSGGKGLPELEVKMYTRSILRGLKHIHANGYVHCDLKPGNILLVDKSGRFTAKIGDFGLAKKAKQCNYSKKRKLMEGCYWKGTPMYLSPEAVMDGVQEAPCDVWAVGCIVLEMLKGKPAWDAKTTEEILAKIRAERGLPKIPNWISEEARRFLMCCFERRPMYRLTCESLVEHPFLDGLANDDDDGVVGEVEGSGPVVVVPKSDHDDELSGDDDHLFSGDSFCSSCSSNDVDVKSSVGSNSSGGFDEPSNEMSEEMCSRRKRDDAVAFMKHCYRVLNMNK